MAQTRRSFSAGSSSAAPPPSKKQKPLLKNHHKNSDHWFIRPELACYKFLEQEGGFFFEELEAREWTPLLYTPTDFYVERHVRTFYDGLVYGEDERLYFRDSRGQAHLISGDTIAPILGIPVHYSRAYQSVGERLVAQLCEDVIGLPLGTSDSFVPMSRLRPNQMSLAYWYQANIRHNEKPTFVTRDPLHILALFQSSNRSFCIAAELAMLIGDAWEAEVCRLPRLVTALMSFYEPDDIVEDSEKVYLKELKAGNLIKQAHKRGCLPWSKYTHGEEPNAFYADPTHVHAPPPAPTTQQLYQGLQDLRADLERRSDAHSQEIQQLRTEMTTQLETQRAESRGFFTQILQRLCSGGGTQ